VKLVDIALKDLVRSFRSLFAVGMMLVAPLLITGIIYFGFGGLASGSSGASGAAPSLPATKVAVVNLDQPALGGYRAGVMLVTYLKDPHLSAWLQVTEMADEAAARAAVDRQAAGVAVIIPPDFSATLTASDPGARSHVTLISDPTLTLGPQIVHSILNQFMDGFSGARIAATVVESQLRAQGETPTAAQSAAAAQAYAAWAAAQGQALSAGASPAITVKRPAAADPAPAANPMTNLIALIMVGELIFFAFFTGAYSAQSILREDEEGTLARLFTTPTSRAVILGGKFLSVFVTTGVQATVLLAAAGLAFGIHWGPWPVVALATVSLVVGASGFGLLLMSFVKNQRQAGAVVGGVISATGMLGGLFTVAVPGMPAAFETVTHAVPQGWALSVWRVALSGGSLGEALTPALVLLAMGIVFFALGVVLFRRRFA
jgi:ABC-type multidrug transport system permease subunit